MAIVCGAGRHDVIRMFAVRIVDGTGLHVLFTSGQVYIM